VICKIDGVEVFGITAAEAAAKLEGAPHSVVELTCRRLVQGQVACGCAGVLCGVFLEAALSLVELLLPLLVFPLPRWHPTVERENLTSQCPSLCAIESLGVEGLFFFGVEFAPDHVRPRV
jgi:hypothetical protein